MSKGKIGLGPYINFQGRAREAMTFYQKVLGGEGFPVPGTPAVPSASPVFIGC